MPRITTMKCLLIEDDVDVATLIVAQYRVDLTHWGVTVAPTLDLARQRLAQSEYDLIVLDLQLPDGTGIELLRETKIDCPVIVLTASTSETDKTNALDAGATFFFDKSSESLTSLMWWSERLATKTITHLKT